MVPLLMPWQSQANLDNIKVSNDWKNGAKFAKKTSDLEPPFAFASTRALLSWSLIISSKYRHEFLRNTLQIFVLVMWRSKQIVPVIFQQTVTDIPLLQVDIPGCNRQRSYTVTFPSYLWNTKTWKQCYTGTLERLRQKYLSTSDVNLVKLTHIASKLCAKRFAKKVTESKLESKETRNEAFT